MLLPGAGNGIRKIDIQFRGSQCAGGRQDMKYIAICLLLLNILYLGYQVWWKDNTKSVAALPKSEQKGALIKLVSERNGVDERQLEVEEILNNPVTEAAPGRGQSCIALGAFEDVVSAQNVAERLNAVDFDVDLRAIDNPTGDFDYRVVLPPAPSLQEAFRKLRELKSRDIDSYVITQGEDSLGISLGVFSSRETAANHMKNMENDGYDVSIKEIPRLSRGYWIYSQDNSHEFPADFLEYTKMEFPEVELTKLSCLSS